MHISPSSTVSGEYALGIQINERPACDRGGDRTEVQARIGKIDIEYKNEVLKAISEVLAEYKDNHAFRYRTLSSLVEFGFSKIMVKG
jgi:hypothetical protein